MRMRVETNASYHSNLRAEGQRKPSPSIRTDERVRLVLTVLCFDWPEFVESSPIDDENNGARCNCC